MGLGWVARLQRRLRQPYAARLQLEDLPSDPAHAELWLAILREELAADKHSGEFEILDDGQATLRGCDAEQAKAFLLAVDRANWRVGDPDQVAATGGMKTHQEALAVQEAQRSVMYQEMHAQSDARAT